MYLKKILIIFLLFFTTPILVVSQGIASVYVEDIYDDQNLAIRVRCYVPDSNLVELRIYGPDGGELAGNYPPAQSCSALESGTYEIGPQQQFGIPTWNAGVYRIDVVMLDPANAKCDPCFVSRSVAIKRTYKALLPENNLVIASFVLFLALVFVNKNKR
ncbi:MAG: hypothetical protein QXM75_02305 [Candidatus Diapherotrites archaeon]